MKPGKLWRQLPAAEYAALFPHKPKALRKIAFGLRRLGAVGVGNQVGTSDLHRQGMGNQVFTMNEWELAKACGVSRRTLQRYLPLFESYGILEVKRWRHRKTGASPNSYRLYFGSVIPENWTYGGGDYPISPRDKGCKELWRNPAGSGGSTDIWRTSIEGRGAYARYLLIRGSMSNPQTLHDISVELKRIGAEQRAAYEAAWDARIAEWEQGIFRVDIGQDG